MNPEELKNRTKAFALRVIRLADALPKSRVADVIGRQLLRSGTSVGANYRAACRARSRADFVAKMKIVEEECDETLYWIELLVESGRVEARLVEDLVKEGDGILSVIVASIKTARSRKNAEFVNRQSSMVERTKA
ncbi:MAG TPA: four helix bundle protein [Phycisphaerae bacterium]|nr:four helix bundle protein [Phycisphaerae bacterium]